MNAKKCDRCGMFYMASEIIGAIKTNKNKKRPGDYIYIVRYDSGLLAGSLVTIELCPKCAEQLSTFLNDPNAAVESYKEEETDG